MRDIKFRAWDTYKKKWVMLHGVESMSSWELFNGRLRLLGEGDTDWRWQQYTGLKDKNGVEIYEGDIVRLRFHEAPDGESFKNGVVQWHQDSSAFKWFSGEPSDLNNYWLTHADDKYREVIGNIYENPELLSEN